MLDLLKKRRSIRKYKEENISKEKIEILLKSALYSPSGNNIKPWEFIIINDKELLCKLSKAKTNSANFIKNSSIAVIVLADERKTDMWIEDCSIAATVLHFTAESLGLGSCWVQVRKRFANEQETSEDYIRQLLDIPKYLRVEMLLAVGYPAESKKNKSIAESDYTKIKYNDYKINYKFK